MIIKRHEEPAGRLSGLCRGCTKPSKLSAFIALAAGLLIWRRKHGSHGEAATV